MSIYKKPEIFSLYDLPAYKELQAMNPGKEITGKGTAIMFGQAIHWLSFLEVIWPDFEKNDYYSVEVQYLVINDPDIEKIPEAFYLQMARIFDMFWRIQLMDLYPNGIWSVNIIEDPEMTVEAIITQRNG